MKTEWEFDVRAACSAFFVTLLCIGNACIAESQSVTAQVAAYLDEMTKGGQTTYRARRALDELPKSEVLPQLIVALRDSPAFRDSFVRSQGYMILTGSWKEVAVSPEGRQFCLTAVHDEGGCSPCVSILGHVPLENRAEVMAAFVLAFDEDHKCRNSILHVLEHFGPDALPLLPRIEAIFNDPNEEQISRNISARVMVNALGIETALDRFQAMAFDTDRTGATAALFAIGRYAGEKKARLESLPEPKRRQAVDLVLAALPPLLSSADPQDRKDGLEALVLTLYAVASGLADRNPKADTVMSVLRHTSLHDSEPEIQRKSSQFVELIPLGMQEIQEMRAKTKPVAP